MFMCVFGHVSVSMCVLLHAYVCVHASVGACLYMHMYMPYVCMRVCWWLTLGTLSKEGKGRASITGDLRLGL